MLRRSAVVLVGLGLALLLLAWVFATQPFTAPDEASHYLRALTIANGRLLGPPVPYHVPATPAQHAWAQKGSRGAVVPAALSPPDVLCQDGKPDTGGGSCLEATEAGNYHPLPYLLPALALSVSDSAVTGLWLSRGVSALLCMSLIGLALGLLWSGSALSVIGLLVAVTPMVLFVSSVLNPNGLEVAASIAFAAALLRVARQPRAVPRWVWGSAAVTGAITILSWQLGPVFAAASLAMFAALLGPRGLRPIAADGRTALGVGAVLALAAIVWLVYGLASGVAHSQFGTSPLFGSLHAGLGQLGPVLRDSIGTFGSLTVPLPTAARWVWWALAICLVGSALWASDRRERLVLGTTVLLVLAFPVVFYAWVYRFSGFGMQGRYVLPLTVLVPLLSGELLHRHSDRLPRLGAAWLLGAGIAVIAIFQAYAWFYDARDVAGAPGAIRFYAHAAWKPPLGWIPWIVVAAVGALSLLAFAVGEVPSAAKGPRRPAARPG